MRYWIITSVMDYLPGEEPYRVDSLEEARDALQDELDRTADAHEEYGGEEAAKRRAAELPESGGCIELGGYRHEAVPLQPEVSFEVIRNPEPDFPDSTHLLIVKDAHSGEELERHLTGDPGGFIEAWREAESIPFEERLRIAADRGL